MHLPIFREDEMQSWKCPECGVCGAVRFPMSRGMIVTIIDDHHDRSPACEARVVLLEFDTVIAECCDCGETRSEMLGYGSDPYADEIGGDDSPVWQCDGCAASSAHEI